MKFPIHQISCSLCLFQRLNVFALHGFCKYFLAHWNGPLYECVDYFLLLELEIEDVEVFAAHVVAYNWNASINCDVPWI